MADVNTDPFVTVNDELVATKPEFQCPRCDETELTVNVVFSGTATCRFGPDQSTEVVSASDMESEIPRLGKCHCRRCGWTGLARDAMTSRPRTAEYGMVLNEGELQHLVRSLGAAHLNPRMREQLNLVVDELIELRRHHRSLQ